MRRTCFNDKQGACASRCRESNSAYRDQPFFISLCLLLSISICVETRRLAAADEGDRTAKAVVQLNEQERTWLARHPRVRWGFDPEWPPFSGFDSNGKPIGIDVDITRLVAARVGLQLTVVRVATWSDVLAKAGAGDVDFLSATAKLPERIEMFNFTERYGSFPVVVVAREEAPFLTLAPEMSKMTIAMPRNHVTTRQLEHDFPQTHFVYTDTAEQALKLVSRRKADATVVNLAVATRAIRLDALTNLKISGITHYEFPIRFAVRKNAPELASILDKGLATLTADEEERIYASHLTPDIDAARDWAVWHRRAQYGMYSALIGAAIASVVLIWNRLLKFQIRRRTAAETALRDAHDRVEQHARDLDLRITEVEKLNADLMTANQNLESFSSSVSHDLRAPLRRVISFAGLMQETAGDLLTEEGRDFIKAIVHESNNMDRLIHDLLEFARLGRTELRKQPVDMLKLVRRIVDDLQPQLQGRTIIWKIGALGEVFGDPNLLRYAMANLTDNALKYTRRRAETRIAIDVCPDGSNEREAVFFVRDNGCGFEMSSAKKIFAPFQRLHTSSEFEGTGIGLANVQRIVQKHGGRIWFESEPDKGATFYFTLPRPPSPVEEKLHLQVESSTSGIKEL